MLGSLLTFHGVCFGTKPFLSEAKKNAPKTCMQDCELQEKSKSNSHGDFSETILSPRKASVSEKNPSSDSGQQKRHTRPCFCNWRKRRSMAQERSCSLRVLVLNLCVYIRVVFVVFGGSLSFHYLCTFGGLFTAEGQPHKHHVETKVYFFNLVIKNTESLKST